MVTWRGLVGDQTLTLTAGDLVGELDEEEGVWGRVWRVAKGLSGIRNVLDLIGAGRGAIVSLGFLIVVHSSSGCRT